MTAAPQAPQASELRAKKNVPSSVRKLILENPVVLKPGVRLDFKCLTILRIRVCSDSYGV
jgi:hypothetical protein